MPRRRLIRIRKVIERGERLPQKSTYPLAEAPHGHGPDAA
jgi:hypothetical protein